MYIVPSLILFFNLADKHKDLSTMIRSPQSENPKLKNLEQKILQFYTDSRDSQGIIFCKTREMTIALVNWMKESPQLNWLNPHNLVGTNSSSSSRTG